VPAIMHLCWHVAGLFAVPYAESVKRRKPFLVKMAFLMRIPVLCLAISTYYFGLASPVLALVFMYLCLLGFSLLDGLLLPTWHDYVSRMMPVDRRGMVFGLRQGLASAVAVGALWLAKPILSEVAFPLNYALIFGAAFISMMISYGTFLPLREIVYHRVQPRLKLKSYFRRMWMIIGRDGNFRRFLAISVIAGLTMMSTISVFTLKAIDGMGLRGDEAKLAALTMLLTIIIVLCRGIALPVFGVLGDKYGNKLVTLISVVLTVAANLMMWQANSSWGYYAAFILIGVGWAGGMISWLNWITEFSTIEDRASYIAIRNLSQAPLFVMPLLGGYLADLVSPDLVFVLAALIGVIAFFLLLLMVHEPRRRVHDVFFGPRKPTRD
jgi:MFS family permease